MQNHRERYADTGPTYRRRTTHELIAASRDRYVGMDSLLDSGVRVIYYRSAPDWPMLIAVEEDDLRRIVHNEAVVRFLAEESQAFDRCIVGRLSQDADNVESYTSWPIIGGDADLDALVEMAVERFLQLTNNFRAWDSFRAYLRFDDRYDVEAEPPLRQVPLEYFCLVGSPSDSSAVHAVGSFPPEAGVFSDPDSGLLPVCTSAFFADIVATEVFQQYGIELTPMYLPCLWCYLTGIHSELAEGAISGVLLNGQWVLDCYECGKFPNGGHYYLHDIDGNSYALHGCKGRGMGPVWWERRWDTVGDIFAPACTLKAWRSA